MTGYSKREIEGRNCRFLQGKDTKKSDVDIIRTAIKGKKQESVQLMNYKKVFKPYFITFYHHYFLLLLQDGTPFLNQFFICPLLDENGKVAYYLGCQAEVCIFFLHLIHSITLFISTLLSYS